MKKASCLIFLLVLLTLFTESFALTNATEVQAAITEASTDDLLLLREMVDAELERRYEAIGAATQKQSHYVLNTNSKKFHIPSCESVNHMKEKNKKNYQGTREEIISFGYKPCGTCNP